MSNVIAMAVLIAILAAYLFIEFSLGRLIARLFRWASRKQAAEYYRANPPKD